MIVGGSVILLAGLAMPAGAVVVNIDEVALTAENAIFMARGDSEHDTGGPCNSAGGGYTPAFDAELLVPHLEDAFDGGLYLEVSGLVFNPGESGDETDEQLTVGPEVLDGLQVTRYDRALQSNPILRSLIKIRNTTADPVTRVLTWDSALGSDGQETTRGSSSGDLLTTKADRWFVTSDDAVAPRDPALLFSLVGKGRVREKVAEVLWAPEDGAGQGEPVTGCIAMNFSLTIAPGATRYLLFFTELSDTNGNAIAAAPKYFVKVPNASLLTGIGNRKRAKILNWDMT